MKRFAWIALLVLVLTFIVALVSFLTSRGSKGPQLVRLQATPALDHLSYYAKHDWRFWTLAIGSAILPDVDVIGFAIGIDYGEMLGHRGFSHSILFALLWSLLIISFEFRGVPKYGSQWWRLFGFFFLVTISHGVLDAMTDGGLGVAFFAPFDRGRYFFAWRPIAVSPIGVGSFFSHWGAAVLLNEIQYVWAPLSLIWFIASILRRNFA